MVANAGRLALLIHLGNANVVRANNFRGYAIPGNLLGSGNHNDGFANVECALENGGAVEFNVQCVVQKLCNNTALDLVGVANAGDAVKDAQLASLVDVAPRIAGCLVLEAHRTNDHGDRFTVLNIVSRCEYARFFTVNDALLGCEGDSAESFLACAVKVFDINEAGIVFGGCPIRRVGLTGDEARHEESHLITLNELVSGIDVFGRAFVEAKELQEVNGVLILRGRPCLRVSSKSRGHYAENHQRGKNQRKNLFHLFLFSLIKKFFYTGKPQGFPCG